MQRQNDRHHAKRRRRSSSNDEDVDESLPSESTAWAGQYESRRLPLHSQRQRVEETKTTSPALGRSDGLYHLLHTSTGQGTPPIQSQQNPLYHRQQTFQDFQHPSFSSSIPQQQHILFSQGTTAPFSVQQFPLEQEQLASETKTASSQSAGLWLSQQSEQSIGKDLLAGASTGGQKDSPPLAADLVSFLQEENRQDDEEEEDSKPAALPRGAGTSHSTFDRANDHPLLMRGGAQHSTTASAVAAFSGAASAPTNAISGGNVVSFPTRTLAAPASASIVPMSASQQHSASSFAQRVSTPPPIAAGGPASEAAAGSHTPNSQESRWWDRYQELRAYRDRHGHCQVPLDHTASQYLALARWVKRQRYQYRLLNEGQPSSMTSSRVDALNSIGFVWDTQAALWAQRYAELKEFLLTHGHTNVPGTFELNLPLATWVKCQRRQYKLYKRGEESNMTAERIAQLDRLGFEWRIRNDYVKASPSNTTRGRKRSSSRDEDEP